MSPSVQQSSYYVPLGFSFAQTGYAVTDMYYRNYHLIRCVLFAANIGAPRDVFTGHIT